MKAVLRSRAKLPGKDRMPSTRNWIITPLKVFWISRCNDGVKHIPPFLSCSDNAVLLLLDLRPHGVLMYSHELPWATHRVHFGRRWSQRRLSLAHAWHDLRRLCLGRGSGGMLGGIIRQLCVRAGLSERKSVEPLNCHHGTSPIRIHPC